MAGEDKAHCALLAAQRCCWCGARPPSQVHHRTGAGMALRAHDHEAMPLCAQCHHDFHASAGDFKRWTKVQKREWQDAMVRHYQRLPSAQLNSK